MYAAYKSNRRNNADVDIYCRENGETIELDVTHLATKDTRNTQQARFAATWSYSDILDRIFATLSAINRLNKQIDQAEIARIEGSIFHEIDALSYHILSLVDSNGTRLSGLLKEAQRSARLDGTTPVLRIRGGGLHFVPWELLNLEVGDSAKSQNKASLIGANFVVHYSKPDSSPAHDLPGNSSVRPPPIIGSRALPPKVFFAMYAGTEDRKLVWAEKEREYFEKTLNDRIKLDVLRPLREAGGKKRDLDHFASKWSAESFDVRHLSCHGTQVGEWKRHLSHFKILVDKDFDIGEKDLEIQFDDGIWLAFLNHCHAANFIRETPSKRGPPAKNAAAAAFATHIIGHSNAAVIASACELDDEFAADMSKAFYSRFLPEPMGSGEDLGTATFEVRRHFIEHRCAFMAMTYRVFGRADMRFAPGSRKRLGEVVGELLGMKG